MGAEDESSRTAGWNAVITRVVESTLAPGDRYFEELVRGLAEALDVAACFITECLEHVPNRVRTLAFWNRGRQLDAFEYDLAGTPCQEVFEGGAAICHGRGVQQLFPDDLDLVELDAESYAAAPVIDGEGRVCGHLAILDPRPFRPGQVDLALLGLVAQVAGAEVAKRSAIAHAKQRELLLRQVLDLVPHAVFAKDAEGRFILGNRALGEIFDVDGEQLLGRRSGDFLGSVQGSELEEHDRRVLQKGERLDLVEREVVDARGRRRHLNITKLPFDVIGSGQPAVLGIGVDVTEQLRADRRLRSLVEATATTFGSEFFATLVKQLAITLGVRWAHLGQIDGPRIRGLALWADGDHALPLDYDLPGAPCAEVVATGAQFEVTQGVGERYRELTWLGELGVESYLGTPLAGAEEETVGVLAILHDEPKSIDEQDRSLLGLFAARAAAEMRRQRAEDSQRDLQAQVLHVQKLESLGVLAGGIAHDFNNLLASVLGNVGLALMVTPEEDERRVYLEEIELAAERSAELTRQMLAYSGKGRTVVEAVDFSAVIAEMVELLRSSVSKKARLRFELEDSLPTVEGDPVQIRQLVLNLITNAAEALEGRAGDVVVRGFVAEAPALGGVASLDHRLDGRCLCLEVRDDGCGMSEETRKRLFDPFYSTKRTGRGLGMATVHGVVRRHRGAIQVDSEPGVGTCLRVWFPCGQCAAPEAVREKSRALDLSPRTGTILVVDDEPAVRRMAVKILEHRGYRVLEAQDGLEALEVFRRSDRIDLVILDLTMPELDGIETLRELRRLAPEVHVLLSSGFSEHDVSEAPADGFLEKPYRPSQLLEQISRLLPESGHPRGDS